MKTTWIVTGIIGHLLHTAVIAQNKPRPVPEFASSKGWWMIESNIHSPKQHIVYFYNIDGVMVYKEKLEDVRLNPQKRKTQMQLKQVLEATIVAWEKEHKVVENETLVVNCLKGKW
ncbi:MAG TPA: hypothetical protein VGE79_08125 [Niastella sp.]